MENKIVSIKNKPHALLLVESKLCDLDTFVKKYIKSIISINGTDEWATKVENDCYFDIIKINGYKNNIKKEDVINIINQLSKSAVETRGIKIYVIYGIEFATTQAINSLLKFLEEPPVNTYAILTTRSPNLVLPTIKSRCQTYILKGNNAALHSKLASFNLQAEQYKIIQNVYYSYDDAITDLQNHLFQNTYTLIQGLLSNPNDLVTVRQIQEQFVKMNYKDIELLLKILIAIIPNNEKLFDLLKDLNINPIKILLFDNIWTIIQKRF